MGSFDTGDPTTTNLYIGNLAPDVDEHVLMREFGRCSGAADGGQRWARLGRGGAGRMVVCWGMAGVQEPGSH
jgi:hypothetical protein